MWTIRNKTSCSGVWKSILHGRDIIKGQGRWVVANNSELPITDFHWVATSRKFTLKEWSKVLKVGDLMKHDLPE